MKTKLTITIEKKNDNLELTYKRKDLVPTETKEEELIVKYIEAVVRTCIDNGFAPTLKAEEDGK